MAHEALDARGLEPPPLHAGRENDGAAPDLGSVVEHDRVHAVSEPRISRLDSSTVRATSSSAPNRRPAGRRDCQFVAGEPAGKAEIVLDSRRCARLPAEGESLDEEGLSPSEAP